MNNKPNEETMNVELKSYEVGIGNHGYGGTEVHFYLEVNGERVDITDEQAEQFMLAAGMGPVVYEAVLDRDNHYCPTDRVVPRIQWFANHYHKTYEEAHEEILRYRRNRLTDAMKAMERAEKMPPKMTSAESEYM